MATKAWATATSRLCSRASSATRACAAGCNAAGEPAVAFSSLSLRERAGVRVRRNDDSQTTAANNHARELAPFAPRHDGAEQKNWETLGGGELGGFKVRLQAPDPAKHTGLWCVSGTLDVGARWLEKRHTSQ